MTQKRLIRDWNDSIADACPIFVIGSTNCEDKFCVARYAYYPLNPSKQTSIQWLWYSGSTQSANYARLPYTNLLVIPTINAFLYSTQGTPSAIAA